VIVNVGYKEIASYAYVYGGNEVIDAPGIWTRKTGDLDPPASVGANQSAANYNFFQLANIPNAAGGGTRPNPYRYAFDDPNGDGLSDANDVYYIPGAFGVSERVRDDTRKSFNGTLQWKPSFRCGADRSRREPDRREHEHRLQHPAFRDSCGRAGCYL
jgi:hypothetical protein